MIPPSAIVTGAVNLPTARNSVPRSIHFLAVVPAPPIAVHRLNPGYGLKVPLGPEILALSRITSHSADVSKLIKEVFLSSRAWLMESH
jgi:hypothetical protein